MFSTWRRRVLLLAVLALLAFLVARHSTSTDANAPSGPSSTKSTDPAVTPTTAAPTSSAAVVISVDYSRDSDHPSTGTYRAECGHGDTAEWRVTVPAAVAKKLQSGDPCPAGEHELLPQQQYPELWSALNSPMPFSGGNADGPCWSWSAADQENAAQMRAAYDECMAQHGGR